MSFSTQDKADINEIPLRFKAIRTSSTMTGREKFRTFDRLITRLNNILKRLRQQQQRVKQSDADLINDIGDEFDGMDGDVIETELDNEASM